MCKLHMLLQTVHCFYNMRIRLLVLKDGIGEVMETQTSLCLQSHSKTFCHNACAASLFPVPKTGLILLC